ncbi:MAG: hypothetical protein ABJN26_00985 [Stappiaceae bacterium]
MSAKWIPALVFAAAGVVSTGNVMADSGVCNGNPLLQSTTDRQVSYLDLGEKGKSPGDQRIGTASVVDPDGNKVGETFWQVTMLFPAKDSDAFTVSGSQYFHFPEGKIYLEVLINQYGAAFSDADKLHPKSPADAAPTKMLVLGGTEKFEGVTGTMTLERSGETLAYNFDLNCPG